jgi:hypothetical protein
MDKNRLTVCRLEECHNFFLKKVHNQAFCCRECCRVYTNARILAAYHEKKNRTMTGRVCKKRGCKTILSRYNEGEYCSVHEQERHVAKLRGWGWECDEEGNVKL